MTTTAESAFAGRADLAQYGDNSRLLFALQLRCDVDDVQSIAESALVDGPDDKGCDLVFIDRGQGLLIVAQGYESQRAREAAPDKKSDTLSTAATWLFSREYEQLPERLKSVALEVRTAIGAGEIERIELWFVHNLPESINVARSMKTVEETVRNAIIGAFGAQLLPDPILGIEVGIEVQREWYEALSVHILVGDEFALVGLPGLFQLQGNGWESVVTAVRASWLREQYKRYQEKLFSANYREYLGLRKNRTRNEINEGIQVTATEEPDHFWVYNNGVSAIVSGFQIEDASINAGRLTFRGLSIVNGAQTTGAVGSLPAVPADSALVPIRFIRCNDNATIADIVRYNNSQNPLVPADFKSNDSVQRRLREECAKIPECEYAGGRRGIDRIIAAERLMPSDTCGQALAAFHGRPDVAYHMKAEIWRDDEIYQKFFSLQTSGVHIVFAFSLLKAIERKKKLLRDKGNGRTEQEERQFDFLSERGATCLLAAGIGGCMESVLGRRIRSKFALSFGPRKSPAAAVDAWGPIVDALIAFSQQLGPGTRAGVKDKNSNQAAIDSFCQQVEAFKTVGAAIFSGFRDGVIEA